MKGWLFFLAAVLIPAPILFPSFCFHTLIVIDFLTPWKIFDSPLAKKYHSFLTDRLPDRPELSPIIVDAKDVTREILYELSEGYTKPVVVRGMLKDTDAMDKWRSHSWWKENYGNESVLCKYVESLGDSPECTIEKALGDENGNGRLYVSGESRLFVRRPELQQMVNSESIDAIAPGSPVFTQLFLGYVGMGSDIHSAVGCNLFRQITGRKKWWLIPTSQTPLVFPSLNPNGFSAHTKTNIGKGTTEPSPWLTKIERYVVTLNPGDMLLNPAWYWHGILNQHADESDPNELVIGVPTRYKIPYSVPAFKNNWLLTSIALVMISKTYGLEKFLSDPSNLQNGIEKARKNRAQEMADMTAQEEALERALA